MTKIKLYTLLLLFIFAAAIGIQSCSSPKEKIPALLERKKAVGTEEESTAIKNAFKKAVDALKANPDDLQQYVNLASVYVAEGRVTGNNTYYGNAAMEMLNNVIDSKTANKDIVFQALNVKSAIELNMHQFKDALETAKKGEAINNYNAGIYGALVDANVEMGNYGEAVKDCDKMLTIRPDLRSYSRASYLRQINGENAGAVEAMKMAVEAGLPGSENTEWARTTLADLYLNLGNVDSASILYRTSLVYRPSYPFAIIGLARVEKARKNYEGAITHARAAIQVMSDVAFVALLGDLYELKGDKEKAADTRKDVIRLLEEGQKDENEHTLVKHNVSREMAMANLAAGNLDEALKFAKKDLEMRPANIDANELAAWISYLKKDYTAAKTYADKMLATNTKMPATSYKAGAIFASAGDGEKGRQMMSAALAANPYIDQRILMQAQQPLASLSK